MRGGVLARVGRLERHLVDGVRVRVAVLQQHAVCVRAQPQLKVQARVWYSCVRLWDSGVRAWDSGVRVSNNDTRYCNRTGQDRRGAVPLLTSKSRRRKDFTHKAPEAPSVQNARGMNHKMSEVPTLRRPESHETQNCRSTLQERTSG